MKKNIKYILVTTILSSFTLLSCINNGSDPSLVSEPSAKKEIMGVALAKCLGSYPSGSDTSSSVVNTTKLITEIFGQNPAVAGSDTGHRYYKKSAVKLCAALISTFSVTSCNFDQFIADDYLSSHALCKLVPSRKFRLDGQNN